MSVRTHMYSVRMHARISARHGGPREQGGAEQFQSQQSRVQLAGT